jgi:hypothetical protein
MGGGDGKMANAILCGFMRQLRAAMRRISGFESRI